MSALLHQPPGLGPEVGPEVALGPGPEAGRECGARRVRHEVRDGLAVIAVSAGGSALVTLALTVLMRWLAHQAA
ncbi:MAG: hypothetical protein QM655_02540 [Nocardioidaceae bacterium]